MASEKIIPEFSQSEYDSTLRNKISDYASLAAHIVETMGCTEGTMLQVDAADGCLAAALAEITELDFILTDSSPKAVESILRTAQLAGYANRIRLICSSEQQLGLEDEAAEWCVSIGAMGSWSNVQQGIEECYRCLKPNGRAYLNWGDRNTYRDYFGMLKAIHMPEFAVCNSEDYFWIDITKPQVDDEEE